MILVSRQGVGLGFLEDDEAWKRLEPAAKKLQQAYGSWDEMAQAYMVVRRGWFDLPTDGSKDDENEAMAEMHETIDIIREAIWADTPWELDWTK